MVRVTTSSNVECPTCTTVAQDWEMVPMNAFSAAVNRLEIMFLSTTVDLPDSAETITAVAAMNTAGVVTRQRRAISSMAGATTGADMLLTSHRGSMSDSCSAVGKCTT